MEIDASNPPFVTANGIVDYSATRLYASWLADWCDHSVFQPEHARDPACQDAIHKLASMYDTPKDLIEKTHQLIVAPSHRDQAEIARSDHPIQWLITRDDAVSPWIYHYCDHETRSVRTLRPGDTIPYVPCLPLFDGVQHLCVDTMPEVVLCYVKPQTLDGLIFDLRDVEQFRDLFLLSVDRGIGSYFDLSGYVRVGTYQDLSRYMHQIDIFVKIPSRAKSARSAVEHA